MTFVTTNSSEAIKFDKALDINAAVQLDSTLTVGVNDTGYDVKFFGATSGKSLLWDESADSLIVTGTTDLIGTTNLDIVDIDGAVNIATTALVTGVLTTTATQVANGGITSGSNIVSDTDSTDDLGTTSVRWANLFVDGITATDQITATGFTGTLDGILGSGTPAAATVTTLNTSGVVNLNLTTDSSSSTSGALIVDGGVGIAAKLFVGTDLDVDGTTNLDIVDIDGAVNIGAEVTLADANKIIFNDASQFIHASSDVILNLGATDEIDLTATAIDVNGTMDVSGNATFASNIGIGGGALQSYHANVTSALALDDQSSIFTRSNQLIIANNFYYGASDAGLAIEDGKSSAIFYDRDQLRLVFAASVNAGQPSSLQEKLSVSETGLLTIKDDLIIKTDGTIGGASDPDLLTLSANNLLINGGTLNNKINTLFASQNGSTADHTSGFKFCNDENGGIYYDSSADDLSIFANQATSNIFLRTAGDIALTLDSSQTATFSSSVTATSATFNTGNVELLTNATSYQWSNAGNNVSMQGTSGEYKIYTGTSGYTLALTIASNQAATFSNQLKINAGNGNQLYLNNSGEQYTQITFDHNTSGSSQAYLAWDNTNSFFEMYAKSGGGLKFFTNATEHMRISSGGDVTVSTGNLVIGTAGKKKVHWTPVFGTISGTTVTSRLSQGRLTGRYTKIGRQVFIEIRLD
jgi:hypothetical protein